MSSYYEWVLGNLSPGQIARSEDINFIQTNIQTAFQEALIDLYGNGCILDENEDALKLIPTPDHIDQSNLTYDTTDNFISFYDRYFRQEIRIEKSEIQSISVQMRNDSNVMPTVFAEIRDQDMNLVKESNVKLESTIGQAEPLTVKFDFNLEHLPVGIYYFVIRPIDISSTDLTTNGDETIYDVITSDMFLIRYDKNGSYCEGLQASYNGVDYLNANLLEDKVQTIEDIVYVYDNNFDLYFEQIYSSGNTYIVNPATCIVEGQKTYLIDTHVTIDGPSQTGDRIDLITLHNDGRLYVTPGLPYTGAKTEDRYPINTSGFKIAYITTYKDTTKTPLIEQDDDNGITRLRDILERLRRLEKKITYQEENNSLSRIKYTCTINPTIDREISPEGSYGISTDTNEQGEPVITFDPNANSEFLKWSIIKKKTTVTTDHRTVEFKITANEPQILIPKPKTLNNTHYLNIQVLVENVDRVLTVREKSQDGTNVTTTEGYWVEKGGIDVIIEIAKTTTVNGVTTKGKTIQKIEKQTNLKGKIQVNLYNILDLNNLKMGEYTAYITCYEKKIQVPFSIRNSAKAAIWGVNEIEKHSVSKKFKTSINNKIESTNVDNSTITGDDSFYRENIEIDTDKGEVCLAKTDISKISKTTWENIPKDARSKLRNTFLSFTIPPNSESAENTYAMLNFEINKDCTIHSIIPYIWSFTNIKEYKILLFENNKIFNINTNKNSYIKNLTGKNSDNSNFKDIYESKWTPVKGTSKNGTIRVNKSNREIFTEDKDGHNLNATLEKDKTYSLLILGRLDKKEKEGKITIKQYYTGKTTKYSGLTKVRGNLNKIYIEKNKLVNTTFLLQMKQTVHEYRTTGTLISKPQTAKNNITHCTVDANFDFATGTDIGLFVSNNGGKTYIEISNSANSSITFPGSGKNFVWKLIFNGTKYNTPKLKFNKSKKYAIRFTLAEQKNLNIYEDYGRCFATPLLNANAITRQLARNDQIESKFEEWEFSRLWMDDPNKDSTVDICFSYANDEYNMNVNTLEKDWAPKIFFSQILCNLTLDDFSQTSIDYSNYIADVEFDENNYRLKHDPEIYNHGDVTISTPTLSDVHDYHYGDITNDKYDMSDFNYDIKRNSIIYQNNDDDTTYYSGVNTISSPYYQALYTAGKEAFTTDSTTTTPICWSNDDGAINNIGACIIGVSFANGIKIDSQYTGISLNIFPNLRDCVETKDSNGTVQYDENGNTVLNPEKAGKDTTKYCTEDGRYYIPANTLEIIVSLNPYGLIEDDNFVYGITYPIDVDLVSCQYTEFEIEDLSNLYGATIYSIGIRVRDGKGWTTKDNLNKNPSLHEGDILGLGNISFKGYNIKPYNNYIYSGSTKRWDWMPINSNQDSTAYILAHTSNYKWAEIPLPKNRTNMDGAYTLPSDQAFRLYEKEKENGKHIQGDVILKSDSNQLYLASKQQYANFFVIKEKNNANNILTTLNGSSAISFTLSHNDLDNTKDHPECDLFKNNTNIALAPYNWVEVQYYLRMQDVYDAGESLYKGEIILDLYDTTDYANTEPIESLPLPAWGAIANGYTGSRNKVVHAWFKLHTEASYVKCIVLRRATPIKREQATDLHIVIKDILFINSESVPALGPQMHMRIYPKDRNALNNTKIRKFGGVYRIG